MLGNGAYWRCIFPCGAINQGLLTLPQVFDDQCEMDKCEKHDIEPGKHAIQHPRLRPLIHACIDGVPVAEPLRQPAPFAAVFGDVQDGIQHLQIVARHVAALGR